MKVEMKDKGRTYKFDNVHWLSIAKGEMTINYDDEEGENHECFDKRPDYIRVMEHDWQFPREDK